MVLKADRQIFAPAFSSDGDGVRLSVRVTPRAGRTGIDGLVVDADGRASVQVRLVAAPVEGAANASLIAALAAALNLRKRDITIRSGATSRQKILHLAGDAPAIVERLELLLNPTGP
ncbi:DUF167 family protein [Lichenihabitans sp. PAMC28606]|uniref:DUF167 family protein n=1 Tax=Lichenihabitans sp. PAMC28606 TaxID=2880932 RepID=UPI001D0B34ED|nr:DUF167 family protein [Lichenihabitans sp. PAMC28606]UDL93285.1 DUF167 family protein [Lichenihabitans sp. PAMC28606]